jgi:valyl-tRNA synthetase
MQAKQHTDKHPTLLAKLQQAPSFAQKTSPQVCDAWFIEELKQKTAEIEQHIKTYRFDLMANSLYSLLWEVYCDWYVEFAKITFQNIDGQALDEAAKVEQKQQTLSTLIEGLYHILKLLHPIMPFITEALFAAIKVYLPKSAYAKDLCLGEQAYPVISSYMQKNTAQDLYGVEELKAWIQNIRQMRSQINLSPAQKVPLHLHLPKNKPVEDIKNTEKLLPYLKSLAKLEKIELKFYEHVSEVEKGSSIGDLIFELIVIESEDEKAARIKKSKKQQQKLIIELEKCQARLNAPGYTDKAPAHLVEQDRQRIQNLKQQIEVLGQQV